MYNNTGRYRLIVSQDVRLDPYTEESGKIVEDVSTQKIAIMLASDNREKIINAANMLKALNGNIQIAIYDYNTGARYPIT